MANIIDFGIYRTGPDTIDYVLLLINLTVSVPSSVGEGILEAFADSNTGLVAGLRMIRKLDVTTTTVSGR